MAIIKETGLKEKYNDDRYKHTEKSIKTKVLEYGDWLAHLYPEEVGQGNDIIKSKRVRTFTFQVTDKCNLACTYCYQINKGTRRMSFDVAKRAVDMILEGSNGMDQLINEDTAFGIIWDFIGGEPFLEVELIDQICEYIIVRMVELNHPWLLKSRFSICSNGVLYFEPKVQKFIEKYKNFLSFSVTVDGTKELHDKCRIFPDGRPSYDLAHAAAMDWNTRFGEIGSKITIAPANVPYLCDCLKQMLKDKYQIIHANYVYEEGWTVDNCKQVYTEIKKFTDETLDEVKLDEVYISFLDEYIMPNPVSDNQNWCGGNGDMLAVDPEGRFYPCLRYMESSLGDDAEPIIIGNVYEGILQKECDKDCLRCMQKITRRSQSTDECFYCTVAKGCSWCTAYNYQVNKTVDKRATFICWPHRIRSLASCYYINKHVQKGEKFAPYPIMLPKHLALQLISEEEYNELVELTKSVGGYVNETDLEHVSIKGYNEGKDNCGWVYDAEELTYFDDNEPEFLKELKKSDAIAIAEAEKDKEEKRGSVKEEDRSAIKSLFDINKN